MGNKSLWAKKQENAGCYQWLPLSQHLIDTMLVAGLLWEHWLNPGQRQFITQSLRLQTQDGADIAKRVVMLLGAVHDIGKATPAFQKHKRHQSTGDLEAGLPPIFVPTCELVKTVSWHPHSFIGLAPHRNTRCRGAQGRAQRVHGEPQVRHP